MHRNKAEAEHAHHVHGRVVTGQRSGQIRGRMAEWSALGGYQNPHGLQPGGLRWGVYCHSQGTGNHGKVMDDTGESLTLNR